MTGPPIYCGKSGLSGHVLTTFRAGRSDETRGVGFAFALSMARDASTKRVSVFNPELGIE